MVLVTDLRCALDVTKHGTSGAATNHLRVIP
jgi:hypothetical protein